MAEAELHLLRAEKTISSVTQLLCTGYHREDLSWFSVFVNEQLLINEDVNQFCVS